MLKAYRIPSRVLLVVFVLAAICVAMTWVIVASALRQQRLTQSVADLGGRTYLDTEVPVSEVEHTWKGRLAKLFGQKSVGRLRHVEMMSASNVTKINAVLQELTAVETVKSLWLQGSAIDDSGVALIAEIPNLEEVFLNGNQGPVPNLEPLRRSYSLEFLGLSSRQGITREVLEKIAKIPRLKELDLSFTDAGDESLEALTDAPCLESLTLSCTKVTDNGVAAVSRIRSLRKLTLDAEFDEELLKQRFPRLDFECK